MRKRLESCCQEPGHLEPPEAGRVKEWFLARIFRERHRVWCCGHINAGLFVLRIVKV